MNKKQEMQRDLTATQRQEIEIGNWRDEGGGKIAKNSGLFVRGIVNQSSHEPWLYLSRFRGRGIKSVETG